MVGEGESHDKKVLAAQKTKKEIGADNENIRSGKMKNGKTMEDKTEQITNYRESECSIGKVGSHKDCKASIGKELSENNREERSLLQRSESQQNLESEQQTLSTKKVSVSQTENIQNLSTREDKVPFVNLFNICSRKLLKIIKINGKIMMNLNKYLISKEITKKRLSKMRKRKRILDWKISKLQSESDLLQSEMIKVGQTGNSRKESRFFLCINFKLNKIKAKRKLILREDKTATNKRIMSKNGEEDLYYQICPLRPTWCPRGTRAVSSGRLGRWRKITTKILVSTSKLGRNPLIDRPLSFSLFTFDGTCLLRSEEEREEPEPFLVKRKPWPESYKSKPRIFTVKKHQNVWRDSRLNSRIKTLISRNGTIQITLNKTSSALAGKEGRNFSKYYTIRRQNSSCSSPGSQGSKTCDRIEEEDKINVPGAIGVKPKKEKKPAEMKSLPLKVKVKYKNLYGRVIEYAKHLPRTL